MTEQGSPIAQGSGTLEIGLSSPSSSGVQDRRKLIERLTVVAGILGLLSIGLYVFLYLQTGVWQILADAGLVALAVLCMLPTRWQARQRRYEAAGLWILLAVCFAYGLGTVVWSGTALYNAVGGILLILLVASVIRPRRWALWLGMTILYLALVLVPEWLELLPRYDIANSSILRVHVPTVTGALVLLTLWQVARAFRVGNIRTRLFISFVGIALVVAMIVTGGAALGGVQRWTSTLIGAMAGAGLLGVLVAAGAWLFLSRSIASPLADLAGTAQEIAEGDLTRVAKVEREDEIGTLAQAFNSMTAQLREVIGSLEDRVHERTRELERRSAYLQASAEVGRAAASILETEQLIQQVVELIRKQFGLYYVGLFLLDDSGEWAVLRAGTGEAGQQMLARGHRIQVGVGMIGWTVAHAEPRVALEAGEAVRDRVRLATAELPETRSEAALPLRSARRAGRSYGPAQGAQGAVLGALSVQHTEPGAFDQETLTVLQLMADQVAVALDNARLFAERQEALDAAQRAYGELSRQAWTDILSAQPTLSYRSDEQGVAEAGDFWRPEMDRALQAGQTMQGLELGPGGGHTLAVPIKVRGQVVGVLDTFKPAEAGDWTPEEIALLEAIAAQLDPALESARLYQDTQRRAAREQSIRHVTDQMRRAVDVEAILQNTVAELAKALGAPRAYVRLGTGVALAAKGSGTSEPDGSPVNQTSSPVESPSRPPKAAAPWVEADSGL